MKCWIFVFPANLQIGMSQQCGHGEDEGEVLQMYYDKQGITLRDRIISQSTEMAGRFAGVLARPVNWICRTRRCSVPPATLRGLRQTPDLANLCPRNHLCSG